MIRSKNNNLFAYSSYWQAWSRILFHDHGGMGMKRMREKYQIPGYIDTIEVDLTGINDSHFRDKVLKVNIRCFSGANYEGKHLRGTLPTGMFSEMYEKMPDSVLDTLLHADLLKYIDFEKYRTWNNGGAIISHIAKEFMTLDQYWAMQKANGGGPGLLKHDVMEAWAEERHSWEEGVKRILPPV